MLQEDPSETLQTPSSTSSGEERTEARGTGDGYNYLLFSDVHLGSDIVPHLRPWATTSWLTLEADVDAQIVGLLAHYRRERDAVRPWCLILAGDFLDLVGMSLPPSVSPMRTELTLEEQHYGLGSAPDHVVHKVEAIARRHPKVFCALMEFIADGHSLVIVRGNHDIELHWRAAQSATITAIVAHAPRSSVLCCALVSASVPGSLRSRTCCTSSMVTSSTPCATTATRCCPPARATHGVSATRRSRSCCVMWRDRRAA